MFPNLFGLAGLGAPSTAEVEHAAELLTSSNTTLTPELVRDYLLLLPSTIWKDAGFALIERGANPTVVTMGLYLAQQKMRIPWSAITGTLTVASAALSAYHGGKRNQSIGWGVWWFMMGLLFPIVTPVIGIAQGFGRPKEK